MNILVTGVTATQNILNFHLKQQLQVIPSLLALVSGLRMLGHTVLQRPVTFGEDLSKYDKIITYLFATNTFVSRNTDGALWTLSRPDTLIAFDDSYNMASFADPFVNMTKKYDPLFGDAIKCLLTELNKKILDLLHAKWAFNRHVLMPAFTGTDSNILYIKPRLRYNVSWATCTTYDPNPLLPLRKPKAFNPNNKLKVWVVSALSKGSRSFWKNKNHKVTLPVILIGGRKKLNIRLKLPECVDFFAEKWFHGMCKILHPGWWRARPQQVIDAGSILWCVDKRLAAILGPTWLKISPEYVLNMSTELLVALNAQMKKLFYLRHPVDQSGLDRSLEQLKHFISLENPNV